MMSAIARMSRTHHIWTAMATKPRTAAIPASSFPSFMMIATTAKEMAITPSAAAPVQSTSFQVA